MQPLLQRGSLAQLVQSIPITSGGSLGQKEQKKRELSSAGSEHPDYIGGSLGQKEQKKRELSSAGSEHPDYIGRVARTKRAKGA